MGTLRKTRDRRDAGVKPLSPCIKCNTAGLHTPARLADGLEPGVALSSAPFRTPVEFAPVRTDSRLGSPATPVGVFGVPPTIRLCGGAVKRPARSPTTGSSEAARAR